MDEMVLDLVKSAPSLGAFVLIVLAFLKYLRSLDASRERAEKRREALDARRDETIEAVGRHIERNTVVLERVEDALTQPKDGEA